MAIKYYTGFESDAAILAGDAIVLSSTPTVTTSERHRTISGRGGSKSIQCNGAADSIRIPAFTAGVGEEVAIAVHHSAGAQWQVTFNNSSVSENCSVRLDTDGFVRIHRSGTILATSGATLASSTWNWLLMKVTAREAASAGRVEVFVNGSGTAFVDTGAGVDCRLSSDDDFDSVEMHANAGTVYWDDYIQAGAGTLPDQALYIQMIRPSADSTPTDGVPSTGTDAFAVVDEDPVSTVDYNELTAATDEDRFTFTDLGFTPLSVLAVRTMSHMTAEGILTDGRGVVRSGGVDAYGVNRAITTGGLYGIVGDIFEEDPSSNPWTGTTVDAIIGGYQVN